MAALCLGVRGCATWLALIALALAAPPRAAAADDALATADLRRALTLLNVVAEEYREGVVDGSVVLPVEYEEAKAFLDEAQARVRGAAPAAGSATDASFASARAGLATRAPLEQVRADLDAIRAAI